MGSVKGSGIGHGDVSSSADNCLELVDADPSMAKTPRIDRL